MDPSVQPLLHEGRITTDYWQGVSEIEQETCIDQWKRYARHFLASQWGHYVVLFLVTIDVCACFADFLIQLHICELKQGGFGVDGGWEVTQEVLGISSLVISCLFMVELIVSVLSFGMGYFSDYFHTFDALVIIVAFTIEVSLRGIEEELGSLVIVLRLWRVFQIIEELSSAKKEAQVQYEEEIERLRQENSGLRQRLNTNVNQNDEDVAL
ncbi:hypothetical protein N7495_000501 [Penicillium taxi]|uniref:uncharacterized protein n=1 Tax=Penicillium taxi TaxID=168475 RepID=UPI002545859D|nr:uncharacterized protein N7495_000501 [Penicillium taxi]KAJ5907819.1 hypothetical protein N7495_000501 [Penicillium taxi]